MRCTPPPRKHESLEWHQALTDRRKTFDASKRDIGSLAKSGKFTRISSLKPAHGRSLRRYGPCSRCWDAYYDYPELAVEGVTARTMTFDNDVHNPFWGQPWIKVNELSETVSSTRRARRYSPVMLGGSAPVCLDF